MKLFFSFSLGCLFGWAVAIAINSQKPHVDTTPQPFANLPRAAEQSGAEASVEAQMTPLKFGVSFSKFKDDRLTEMVFTLEASGSSVRTAVSFDENSHPVRIMWQPARGGVSSVDDGVVVEYDWYNRTTDVTWLRDGREWRSRGWTFLSESDLRMEAIWPLPSWGMK